MEKQVLRINQIKLKPNHTARELEAAVAKKLLLNKNENIHFSIAKRSIDARHKPDIYYIYSVDVYLAESAGETVMPQQLYERFSKVSKKQKERRHSITDISLQRQMHYEFPHIMTEQQPLPEQKRPVIIGFGPAGMFAALKLAEAGLCPVVYERGEAVAERRQTVQRFWDGGALDTESNVQFGEGGAGTFSDGKLNTMIKDPTGRIRETLEVFAAYGADSAILYTNKPHIGTDVLYDVVKNIRQRIISLGGEVHFNTKLLDIRQSGNVLAGITLQDVKTGRQQKRDCGCLCLSIGHSARDTFEMLEHTGFIMQPKAFAVGLRLEHPQEFVDYNAYGNAVYKLPAADYKVTYQTADGRGVYSFCMCPGGYVVNASSEQEQTAVNGMSYSGRDGRNANSAIIVTVSPADFGDGVLAGMQFQRKLEALAYRQGQGKIPVQLLADFQHQRCSTGFGSITPCMKGDFAFGDLNRVLPPQVASAISEGVTGFAQYIKGFDMEDAVFSGVESRTSSPVRIMRNENLESSVRGVFPCGEGAGYAGGITSAAVDGIKVAEQMAVRISESFLPDR